MATIAVPGLMPLLGLLVLAGAAACGPASGQDSTEPDGHSPRQALRDAVGALVKADTGHYRQELVVPDLQDQALVTVSGDYALSAQAASLDITIREPGESPLKLDGRIVGRTSYLHAPAWPAAIRDCWLRLDGPKLAEASGLSPEAGAVGQYPVALLALDSARGSRVASRGDVTGTVDLAAALSAVFPKATAQLKAAAQGGRSTAHFELADGQLVGWTVEGADVLKALRAHAPASLPGQDTAEALRRVRASSAFTNLGGAPDDISPPPPRRVMTPAEFDSGEGCRD